jgi:anti-anti-sigma factor
MSTARLRYEPIDEQTARLTVNGDVDSLVAIALERTLRAATAGSGTDYLLVDLTDVRVADAALVESLFHVARLLDRQQGRLVVIAPAGSQARSALTTAGLARSISLAATQSEAVNAWLDARLGH